MKYSILAFCTFVLGLSLLLAACKKDEPSYESKFVGIWYSVKYKNNGNEISGQVQEDLVLNENKTFVRFVVTRHPVTLDVVSTDETSGTWSANESSKRLVLDADTDVSMTVKSVSETALVVSFSANSIPIEIEYQKN